jgi:hypothetical protein
MSGRIYAIPFSFSHTAAADAVEVSPADDKPVEFVGLSINQYGVSDIGDAAEELLRWSVIRGHTTSGSGGSAPTPSPIKPSNGAASFAAETGNTTIASTGTTVTLHDDAFNVRAGAAYWWPEGMEPQAAQGNTTMVVRLAAPADAITIVGTLYVRELG